MSTAPTIARVPDWDRLQRDALIAAAVGLGLFVVVGLVRVFVEGRHSPVQFFLSYLVAWNIWLAVALGCLVLLMIQYLTGGDWGVLLRRVLEAAARTLPLLAVLFVPLAVGLFLDGSSLYLWARPAESLANPDAAEELRDKAVWLNPPFFIIRTVIYFACWLLLAFVLSRRSSDAGHGDARAAGRPPVFSGPGLVVYGVTITFASMDWVMSLEPFWYSTVYPALFAVGQLLSGFAFAVAVLVWLAGRPPLDEVVTPLRLRKLGSLLFAFILFWAYMQLSQFLLQWIGNLPEEIPWYLRRSRGGWQWVATVLVVFQFALPLFVLLFRDIKDSRRALAAVAVGLFALRALDVFWWIEPAYPHDGEPLFWLLDVAALVGVGGVWAWWFTGELRRRPLLPANAAALLTEEAGHA